MSKKRFNYTISADVISKQHRDFYIDADNDEEAVSQVKECEGVVESSLQITRRKRYTMNCPRCHTSPVLYKVANGGFMLRCISCNSAEYGYHHDSPMFYGKTEEEVYNAWEAYVKSKEEDNE